MKRLPKGTYTKEFRGQAEASPSGEIADREHARRDMGMAGFALLAIDRRE
jgi:hypothetical protein